MNRSLKSCSLAVSTVIVNLLFSGCESYSPAPAPAPPPLTAQDRDYAPAARRSQFAPAPAVAAEPEPEGRPGLATGWGETRGSSIYDTNFTRESRRTPTGTGKLFYNDEKGLKAMMPEWDKQSFRGFIKMAGNLVSVGVKGGGGSWLKGWTAGGHIFIEGESGERYEVVVRNETGARLECVVSVDGLDVMDGDKAAHTKPGYVLDPYETVTIDGFRRGRHEVAAFRFGSVSQSYSQLRHGTSRNVGVIGLAIFHEKGSDPFRSRDAGRRWNADPFPTKRKWATPPQG